MQIGDRPGVRVSPHFEHTSLPFPATTSLQYPTLHTDAQETLRTLAFSEKQVPTTDGRWFSVRIMPYRRLDNMIDGIVITLVAITKTKELESSLRRQSNP